MRAAIVLTDTRRGGTPTRMAALAHGLAARGWEILFVSVLPSGPVLDEIARDGIATARLDLRSPAAGPLGVVRLRRLMREFRPALVQTALWHANVIGRLAFAGTGIPVVNGYQSVDDDKSFVRVVLDRVTARLAAGHVCVSRAVADRVRDRERIPRSRLVVIPGGKDPAAFAPRGLRDEIRRKLGIPGDARVAGWVGRLHPVKDLRTLVRGVGSLSGWWLLVVGSGVEEANLYRWGRESGLLGRLVAAGEQPDVSPFLEAMDVFCLTSRWEGFPGALVEAMAAGLPVVATSVGGVPEIVTDGEDGLVVPAGDSAAVAAAIEKAAARPELGRRAADTVRARFTLDAMLDRYEELWRSVART